MHFSQVNFAIQVIRRAIKDKVRAVEPTKEAQDRFVERLKSDFRTTVWKGGKTISFICQVDAKPKRQKLILLVLGCNSWYLNSQGDVRTLYSFLFDSHVSIHISHICRLRRCGQALLFDSGGCYAKRQI